MTIAKPTHPEGTSLPLKVGLTGGIGSGKTTIARIFRKMNYPVYIADIAASQLMNNNPKIIGSLIRHFGAGIYDATCQLNRKKLADIIFNDKTALATVNGIVHPVLLQDFNHWSMQQCRSFVLLESAILFESGWEKQVDYVICVSAPTATKIKRVVTRDHTTAEKVLQRMKNQMDDAEKCRLSDFIIHTDEGIPVLEQVTGIIENLENIIKNTRGYCDRQDTM